MAAKIFKNSSWLVSDKLITMLIGAFVTAIIARYFGPELFGQFNYALSFVALFTAFSTLGLETLTVKAIVEEEYDEGTILCTSFFLRIFGGVVLTILATCIIQILEPSDTEIHVLVLIMSLTMVFKAFEVIEYWIQAYQKAKISSLIRIGTYIFSALLKVILVIFRGDLIFYALIYTFDALFVGLALWLAYFKMREKRIKWKLNIKYSLNILSRSWYIILSGLMITLYMRIDQLMLGSIMDDKSELGVFSAATQIAGMWYFVPMALITSFKPIIIRKKKLLEADYMSTIQSQYTIVAWTGIFFGIFISIFSDLIVKVLFGPSFLDASAILSISIWAGTFAMLGSARSTWLITEGLQRYTLIYTALGLVVNVTLNLFLIPSMGAIGAAIATLCSQFAANIIALAFFKNTKVSTKMLIKAFSPKELFKIALKLR